MITLVVISSILIYAVIGAVVFHIWKETATKRHGTCYNYYSYCDHGFLAGIEAIFWPVALPLTGVGYCVYIIGRTVSDKIQAIVKEKVG